MAKKRKYSLKDTFQAIVGAFMTVLLFFALSAGEKMEFLKPEVGMGVTASWFFILFASFKKKSNGENFLINILLIFAFCSILTAAFEIATFDEIIINPFGSPAMIATWLALPVALMFDRQNITSVYSRYYFSGKKK